MTATWVSEIENLVGKILLDQGVELVDVEFKREPVGMVLRVYIDSSGGVDVDMCARTSETISQELDKANLISKSCTLEVSSPGIERPLKKPEHFKKYVGSKIFVKTEEAIEGRKQFKGFLEFAGDDVFVVNCDADKYEIPYDMLKKAHLLVDVEF